MMRKVRWAAIKLIKYSGRFLDVSMIYRKFFRQVLTPRDLLLAHIFLGIFMLRRAGSVEYSHIEIIEGHSMEMRVSQTEKGKL